MNEFSLKSNKGEMLHSMLRRPETSKLIKEALSSPLGSTSRIKARKIFSIMNKLNNSYDGSGGPGMMYNQMGYGQATAPEMDPMHIPTDNSKGMVIFHKIPKPKIIYGNKASKFKARPGSFDGSGGPGAYDGKGGPFDDAWNAFKVATTPSASQSFWGNQTSTAPSQPFNISQGFTPQNTQTSTPAALPQAPAPDPKNVQEGLIHKALDWTTETALPAIGNTIAGAGAAALGLGQYALQNTAQGAIDLGRSIFTDVDVTKPSPGPGYTTLANTIGGQIIDPQPITYQAPKPYGPSPVETKTIQTPTTTFPSLNEQFPTKTQAASTPMYGPVYGGPTTQQPMTQAPVPVTKIAPAVQTGTTGYGGEIVPSIANKTISSLTPEEKNLLYSAQKTREGSTLENNPFGIKVGPATQHWIDEGKATIGSTAKDGGQFLRFNDENIANLAYQDLLYNSGIYSGLTVDEAMKKWSGYSTSGAPSTTYASDTSALSTKETPITQVPGKTYSGITSAMPADVQKAVDSNIGPGMFALNALMDPRNPITRGKTMEQLTAENQKSLWDKYNIGGQQDEINRMTAEGAVLPKNIVSYITARDQYIEQTDKEIDRYVNEVMTSTDMSNPANAAKANAQLNYLYTLRGRQNQTYVGFLNDAVEQHQAALDTLNTHYSTALDAYKTELENANEITKGQYQLYASALADMYTAVQDAPTREQQKRLIEAQIMSAYGQSAADVAKKSAQEGLIEQGKKLEGYVWDNKHMVIPGIDLVKTINDFSVQDPEIKPVNIVQAYSLGVENYLNAPEEKDAVTGTGVTFAGKQKVAEDAIRNFANYAMAGADNPSSVDLGQTSAINIAQKFAIQVGNEINNSGKAQSLIDAVKTLAPRGWFGPKTPPAEEQFVKTVTDKTQDPMDEAIARAIYAIFQRYVSDNGGTVDSATEAVNALLYPTSSTSDRANAVPLTPSQFAQNIGTVYASSLVDKAFSAQ